MYNPQAKHTKLDSRYMPIFLALLVDKLHDQYRKQVVYLLGSTLINRKQLIFLLQCHQIRRNMVMYGILG